MPPPPKRSTLARDAAKGVAVAIAAVQGKVTASNAAQPSQPNRPREATRRRRTQNTLTAELTSDAAAAEASPATTGDMSTILHTAATRVDDGVMVAPNASPVSVAAPSVGQQMAEQPDLSHGGGTGVPITCTPRSLAEVNAADTCT